MLIKQGVAQFAIPRIIIAILFLVFRVVQVVRQDSSFVRVAVAKNPTAQCTSVKILTQPPALATCQKNRRVFLTFGLSIYPKMRFLGLKARSE